MLLELNPVADMNLTYKPGDHLGVFACNRTELVERILQRVHSTFDIDTSIELQMQKQSHTPNGVDLIYFFSFLSYFIILVSNNRNFLGIIKTWIPHDRYLANTFRMLLTRFLDITTPPTPNLLRYFASIATDSKEQAQLELLASVNM